jgi:hypothetical protein
MKETKLVVDGHVHIYKCYDFDKFLSIDIKKLNNLENLCVF